MPASTHTSFASLKVESNPRTSGTSKRNTNAKSEANAKTKTTKTTKTRVKAQAGANVKAKAKAKAKATTTPTPNTTEDAEEIAEDTSDTYKTSVSPRSTPHPTTYPHTQQELVFHPSLCRVVDQYASRNEIMHTLFYGPPGSGKLTLARRLIARHFSMPLNAIERHVQHIHTTKDKSFPFFKSSVHFEINTIDFLPNQQRALLDLLQDLAKTLNVSRNKYKVVVVQNADRLTRDTQHQLRRMMEVFYSTCRLLFISHSLDRVDQTLQSRFVCVRVPRARAELMSSSSPSTDTNPNGAVARDITPHTVDTWLASQFADAHGGCCTIVDYAVSQLWRALLRKTIPVSTFRKWVRLVIMTQICYLDVFYPLLLKLNARHEKHGHVLRRQLCAVTNYYLHQHEQLNRSRPSEFQLEMLLAAYHAYIHHPHTRFMGLLSNVFTDSL